MIIKKNYLISLLYLCFLSLIIISTPVFAQGSPQTARLINSGETIVDRFESNTDQNWYKIDVSSDAAITVSFSHSYVDYSSLMMRVYLYNPRTEEITEWSSIGTNTGSTTSTPTGVPSGTYYIKVIPSMYDPSEVSYNLKVDLNYGSNYEKELNNDPTSATFLPLNTTFNGNFNYSNIREQDWYKFTLNNSNVKVSVSHSYKDYSSPVLFVSLLDSGTREIKKWTSYYGNDTSMIENIVNNLTPGTYYINVTSQTYNPVDVSYTLNVSDLESSTPNPTPTPSPSTPSTGSNGYIFRLYNKTSGEHLYTSDVNEYNSLPGRGWTQEGVAWTAPTSGEPVYRLYSPITGSHLYTKDENEVNTLLRNGAWTADNFNQPLFYSGGVKPVYRLYHEGIRMHLLTTDESEYNILGGSGWKKEGVALNALS